MSNFETHRLPTPEQLALAWRPVFVDTNQACRVLNERSWRTEIEKNGLAFAPLQLSQYYPDYKYFLPQDDDQVLSVRPGLTVYPKAAQIILGITGQLTSGKDLLLNMVTEVLGPHMIEAIHNINNRPPRPNEATHVAAYEHRNTKQIQALLKKPGFIIECIKQGKYLYASTHGAFACARASRKKIIVWRGEPFGARSIRSYCQLLGLPFYNINILSGRTWPEIIRKINTERGSGPQHAWRIPKAMAETELYTQVSDAMVTNWPVNPDHDGVIRPRAAVGAIIEFLNRIKVVN